MKQTSGSSGIGVLWYRVASRKQQENVMKKYRGQRYEKDEVEYTDDHGASSEQCSKCQYYVAPTVCEIVVGKINPGGWCNKFEREV